MRWVCEVLDVSPSGFYSWFKRPPSNRVREDQRILRAIRISFTESDRTYGVRRIWPDVRALGMMCGRERVARLMRAAGLHAQPIRRRQPHDNGERPQSRIAGNVLDREFFAHRPNRKWVADFTYIWTREGWLFVAAVLDLYSRRVVGWSMKAHMRSDLVTDALIMALWRRRPGVELLHHSDQGSQYTSEQFQALLNAHGIECSMSRRGDCWDNAAIESFFSRMKAERINRRSYRTRDEARADVFDYIERFYNPKRRHSTLGYMSPIDYEKQLKSA
jgi:putative transposase